MLRVGPLSGFSWRDLTRSSLPRAERQCSYARDKCVHVTGRNLRTVGLAARCLIAIAKRIRYIAPCHVTGSWWFYGFTSQDSCSASLWRILETGHLAAPGQTEESRSRLSPRGSLYRPTGVWRCPGAHQSTPCCPVGKACVCKG